MLRFLGLSVVLVLAVGCSTKPSASNETIYREDQPPVSAVKDGDPEMAAATKKAISELPMFITECKKELAKPAKERKLMLSVKSAFAAPTGQEEHMWSEVTGYKDGVFTDVLGNDPVYATNFKQGDPVEIQQSDVEDWVILDEKDNMRGGYTARLLMEREEAKDK